MATPAVPERCAWLAKLGPAFRGLKRLRLQAPAHGMHGSRLSHYLGLPFFSGLAACSDVSHLELVGTDEYFNINKNHEILSCPDQLAEWLPKVAELVCWTGKVAPALVQGLGPSLTYLDLTRNNYEYNEMVAAVLPACQQLKQVKVFCIDQQMLDALVQLPALTHVTAFLLGRVKQPCLTSCSAWQELDVSGAATLGLDELACCPLKTTQRLVLKGLAVFVPPAIGSFSDRLQQQQAVTALTAAPDLQWSGQLNINVAVPFRHDLEHGWQEQMEAEAAAIMRQLYALIADLRPLARGCNSVKIHSKASSITGDHSAIGEDAVAALGGSFGSSLRSLQLDLEWCGPYVAPSFWPALPTHLPCLSSVFVEYWGQGCNRSAAALAQLMTTYQGPPLEIVVHSLNTKTIDKLCSVLHTHQTVDDDGSWVRRHLPLP